MRITDFLRPEAIFINMESETSKDVIRKLGGRLFELGNVKEDFVEATLGREVNLPTGLPLGGEINAAIPHVDIEYVKKSALGLATLREPVVFFNMVENDEPVLVRLVIMLALDQPKSQIDMLTSVAQVLQSKDTINQIINATTPDEVLTALAKS